MRPWFIYPVSNFFLKQVKTCGDCCQVQLKRVEFKNTMVVQFKKKKKTMVEIKAGAKDVFIFKTI